MEISGRNGGSLQFNKDTALHSVSSPLCATCGLILEYWIALEFLCGDTKNKQVLYYICIRNSCFKMCTMYFM